MAQVLVKDKPYERFSPNKYGLAPSIVVNLHMPASGKTIIGKKALIDTGAEITWIYPRDVKIDLSSDVDYNQTGEILVGIEVEGKIYNIKCGYEDHEYAGTEEMIIGMDLLSQWFVELHGRRHLLSITHLEPNE